jgi:hypothetical protein
MCAYATQHRASRLHGPLSYALRPEICTWWIRPLHLGPSGLRHPIAQANPTCCPYPSTIRIRGGTSTYQHGSFAPPTKPGRLASRVRQACMQAARPKKRLRRRPANNPKPSQNLPKTFPKPSQNLPSKGRRASDFFCSRYIRYL